MRRVQTSPPHTGALAFIWCCVVAAVGTLSADNYMDPPGEPGSPATRMKTLNELEPRTPIPSLPYVITNQGSYYLTGDMEGTNGIGITTSPTT